MLEASERAFGSCCAQCGDEKRIWLSTKLERRYTQRVKVHAKVMKFLRWIHVVLATEPLTFQIITCAFSRDAGSAFEQKLLQSNFLIHQKKKNSLTFPKGTSLTTTLPIGSVQKNMHIW